jgi:hypothetical protein
VGVPGSKPMSQSARVGPPVTASDVMIGVSDPISVPFPVVRRLTMSEFEQRSLTHVCAQRFTMARAPIPPIGTGSDISSL